MQTNKKYTALELLKTAGVENADKVFGKFKVIIGGVRGIVTPDHLIKVQPNTKNFDILVGDKEYKIKFSDKK